VYINSSVDLGNFLGDPTHLNGCNITAGANINVIEEGIDWISMPYM
jgi:hypothetical protein